MLSFLPVASLPPLVVLGLAPVIGCGPVGTSGIATALPHHCLDLGSVSRLGRLGVLRTTVVVSLAHERTLHPLTRQGKGVVTKRLGQFLGCSSHERSTVKPRVDLFQHVREVENSGKRRGIGVENGCDCLKVLFGHG